ncbi:Uu.00g013650.m01.CDS01 [Anthostomella pinea]|uniref:Uu.00g013650.m01.CDS01 n=1 Tax=Anthostomella pinea TaxID=933095 RepID=A0AAI8VY68_9PEZI|nr:Uu.00g013650.m01.CDS01 [Anthostomella pinea]
MQFTDIFRSLASRPRSSTKGPLDVDDAPLASPLSPQTNRLSASQHASPRISTPQARSPSRPTAAAPPSSSSDAPLTSKDFSFLLKPEIYHQISPLSIPAPFRTPSRQPAPETPIPDLLSSGHFRAAAIAAVQALTSSPVSATTAAAHPPADPTDHARIFELLYTRLACLCLIDAVPLAAQEAKALEDLNSAFYLDPLSGAHLVPWELRTLAVRLQTIGFGDPRGAVMSYYELAREARAEIAKAGRAHDHSAAEVWKRRLAELGVKVTGALVEMDDLASAAEHLASLPEKGGGRLATSRALLWLHLGDVEAATRCVRDGQAGETGARVVGALADMADGEYVAALGKWQALQAEMEQNGVRDEMVGVNLAVCLLYTGQMPEGRDILEGLAEAGLTSHTLLFNLTTMYELCTERAKGLKVKLAERVADMQPSAQGWEKTNGDFKL